MKLRLLFTLAVIIPVAMSGCASTPPGSAPPPQTSYPPTATATTPTPARELTIMLDGIEYTHDGADEFVPLTNGEKILDLFKSLTGTMPTGAQLEGPFEVNNWVATSYEWSEVHVIIYGDGSATNVAVLAPTLNGVPIRTAEGISVGSTRADVVSAHGRDEWDANDDGIADFMGLGSREVMGTKSLSRLDSVGIEYVLVGLENDAVAQIQIPANDFSDS